MLNKKSQDLLFQLSRQSIEYFLDKNTPLPLEDLDEFQGSDYSDILWKSLGCFVTLKTLDHDLRGCIGFITSDKPLIHNVVECAYLASQKDPRFSPVTVGEIQHLKLEISVMGQLEHIENRSWDRIQIGTDGLVIKQGDHQGLLLPQVASENGWDTTTFLEHTCLKAGLLPNSYLDDDCAVFKFSAYVFSEE